MSVVRAFSSEFPRKPAGDISLKDPLLEPRPPDWALTSRPQTLVTHQQVVQALARGRSQIECPRLRWPEVEKIISSISFRIQTLARVFCDGDLPAEHRESGISGLRQWVPELTGSGAQLDSLRPIMGAAWQQPAAAGVWDRLNDASTVELSPLSSSPSAL